jgi:hypothetical protein
VQEFATRAHTLCQSLERRRIRGRKKTSYNGRFFSVFPGRALREPIFSEQIDQTWDSEVGSFSMRMYSTSDVAIMPVSIISSKSGRRRPRFSAVSTIVTTMG